MAKFCTNCGEPLKPHFKVCPNCGQPVNKAQSQNDEPFKTHTYRPKHEEEGDTFVWGVLSFFIPLLGLILFLVWQEDRPKAAKSAGTGALIGVIFGSVFGSFFITGI